MSDVGAALEAVLAARGTPATVRVDGRATVGLSQETWLVTLEGAAEPQEAVLRLPTPASGDRAIRIQRIALELTGPTGLPVPALLAYDEATDNAFGRSFLLMERVRGEIPPGWNALEAGRRRRLALRCAGLLAELHRLDPDAAASAGLRRPDGNPAATELAFYRRRFERLGVSPRSTLEAALRALEASTPPPPDALAVTHNDFRMGNLVVAGDEVAGILDWELAALGDPLADVAWCCISVWDPVALDLEEFAAAYGAAAGRPVDPAALAFYTALGYLRLVYYALSAGSAFARAATDDLRSALIRLDVPIRMARVLDALPEAPSR